MKICTNENYANDFIHLFSSSPTGALFSVVTAVENGASLVSALIFPIVIPLALQHGLSPGVVYLLMASMCILPLLLLL